MNFTEQLKDICERFNEHKVKCPHCAWVSFDPVGNIDHKITMANDFYLCQEGRAILLDIFS